MNEINFNNESFKETNEYKNYIIDNPDIGYLNIRAYAANAAIPITGLVVVVSKIINNRKVIFFKGATDNSGLISSIALPTPSISSDDEVVPTSQDYDVTAIYNGDNLIYKVKMFSNIQVLQNINIVPNLRLEGSIYGS